MQGSSLKKTLKTMPSKAFITRINLFFLAVFLLVYATVLPRPSSDYFENAGALVRCSLSECHHRVRHLNFRMKAALEGPQANKIEVPSFFGKLEKGMKIGMVNMEEEDVSKWSMHGETISVYFERVSQFLKWRDLFPEWIDEEEENGVPSCPEIPMPDYAQYGSMDVIVAKLPCRYPEEGWRRNVFRLQVHLIVANLATKKGNKDWRGKTRVVFWSKCKPMMELFPCDNLVKREGKWWYYEPELKRLEHKVSLPVGSCKLSLSMREQGINKEVYDLSKIEERVGTMKREAYATVLHSSEAYVCGAITLAQSLLETGTKRDLILLIDKSISAPKREALSEAGWKIRMMTRIRNPKAEKRMYNEYNYSKFRLWQLTEYEKVIFIDSDIIVLRNMDILFQFPQISATGNDGSIFNSGIMVIEPSNCTFRTLMRHRDDVVSYNGGDQGFLNEVFVWWHRLPRRVNFLKISWSNTTAERRVKNALFAAPAEVYAIHYLGRKPWHCYRDYDCNWDTQKQRVYASDVAHRRWWKVHDGMEEGLQRLCGLTKRRRSELNRERWKARKNGLPDGHWKINITDPRLFTSLLMD